MRAPNSAEMQPPIPNTEIQIANRITPPVIPEATPAYSFRRAIGRASVILTTTSLASLGAIGASQDQMRHGTDADRAPHTATNTYRLDNATRVAHESTNVYTGRVTIAMTKTARHAAPGDNTGITVANMMGIPEANVKQGKKTEVTIAGRRVDLADYATDNRKAESWKESKDCAWNWAIDDLAISAKAAGLNPEQTKKVMQDPKAITRIVNGYLNENPQLKEDSQHFLTTGVGYKAKHARAEAKKLVGAMRPAEDPDTKPAAPSKVQPQPDAKSSSASGKAINIPKKSENNKNKEMVAGIMKLSGLAGITGLILAGGALVFGRRRRRRNEENELSEKRAGNHRAPDPDDPNDPSDPPEDFSDLRRETEKDKAASWGRPVEPAPIRRPVTNQAINNYGPVELDSNARHLRSVDTFTATSTDVPARSRFSRPSRGRSEVSADAKLSDAPTDPSVAVILPFPSQIPRRYAEPVGPPNTGWISPDVYVGMHRKQYVDDAESDVQKKAVAV